MRLQRRLFLWFGASIFVTGVVVTLVFSGLDRFQGTGRARWRGAVELVSWQAAQVWSTPKERAAWAAHLAEGLRWSVRLEDAGHEPLAAYGPSLGRTELLAPVEVDGVLAGYVRVDTGPSRRNEWWPLLLML